MFVEVAGRYQPVDQTPHRTDWRASIFRDLTEGDPTAGSGRGFENRSDAIHRALAQINPGLILCTAQAYGSETAYRDYPAYDDIVQAASGAARLTELVDGAPRYAPYVIADKVVGLYIVIAVLAAAMEKNLTGLGQAVDVPMVDSMIGFNLVEHFGGHTFSPAEGDFGWARVLTPERVPHPTADGWICIMPYSSKNWDDFFTLAGRKDMVANRRYATVDDRHRHMGELLSAIRDVAPQRTTGDWYPFARHTGSPPLTYSTSPTHTKTPTSAARN
ncbi:hypothetical protein ROP_30690 [Rhodococcus opacus B4]|uniref:CoA-transferase III family protein n=1 Tax=Rhodococcus opacus (strain B4) TaxID=632772 RepID=C1B6L3_RHOOB|nr:hypothetical protein ROP_30690 [Rhodococcus opacus B4]